ncbi:MAG: outer membrane beta-barrel protein [Gammaproteobacteria bacterium]|nr:outer membrane beta-barrel protein [Gammaproteobacteria bacterium]MCH9744017.1 outer membrane beta-barrel protein [Gammaproteobacteria bacterium]
MKIITSLIALLALLASSIGFADSPSARRAYIVGKDNSKDNIPMTIQVFQGSYGSADRSAFYSDLNVGYGFVTSKLGSGVRDDGFAWRVSTGYQFNRYIATETGYLRYPKIEGHGSHASMGVFHILGKFMLPIIPSMNLFATAGIGLSHISSGSTDVFKLQPGNHFCLLVGGGAEYFISYHVAILGEAALVLQKNGSSGRIQVPGSTSGLLGLLYKFS